MIDQSTESQMRQLVEGVHKRGEVVNVYSLAQKIPAFQVGCTPAEAAGRISELAVGMRANVCWERYTLEPASSERAV